MAVLILNKAPYYMYPYEKWLREGEQLLLLNDEGTVQGYKDGNYAEIYSFSNYEKNGCIELTALELYEKYQFHSIVAAGEYDLLRAGKLRDLLGIQGQTWESALAYRDKVTMKNIASEHGIPVPEYKRIHTSFELIRTGGKAGDNFKSLPICMHNE
ncbi:hypothetical protein [Lysinibacillus sp. G4S2]|uniref:hypothetical protein n=1 Tax=Lysinibacillus sp. G4S2 TaxID=3055859 RepID=UPI0025A1FC79|nr:hypothetical protein [Lysinibacillus sp. G4S2]MDM5248467.1 hypothetical protein [Lysinibacillus sp. G4S2]